LALSHTPLSILAIQPQSTDLNDIKKWINTVIARFNPGILGLPNDEESVAIDMPCLNNILRVLKYDLNKRFIKRIDDGSPVAGRRLWRWRIRDTAKGEYIVNLKVVS
jgi:hypothetical protein